MTLEGARARVGSGVVYRSRPGAPGEDGVIVAVRGPWVMVRYRGDEHAKATGPESLEFLSNREEARDGTAR